MRITFPNSTETRNFGRTRSIPLSGKALWRVAYAATAVLSAWIFVYISGLFPYLGFEQRSEQYFPGGKTSLNGIPAFGTKTMLLFAGQTAFIDYDIETSGQGGIYLDVKPFYHLGFSGNEQKLNGSQNGRVEFPIEQTGIYQFRSATGYFGTDHRISYKLSWGAN
ncbi:MAG: hypothetical protein WBM39_04510 [Parasphingorhabdus sp.]